MRHQPFDFIGGSGGKLSGRLDLPDKPPQAYALFAHCFTCSKQSIAAARIGRALAERGIALLRFDFTGLGESDGEFGAAGFSSDVADVIAAAEAMTAAGMAPSLLIGHSLGGAAVLAAAGSLPIAAAVATINAPFDVGHVTGQFGDSLKDVVADGEATVALGGRPFTLRRSFVEDLAKHDLGEAIHRLRRPLLILHSPTDSVVGINNASSIFLAARHPKSFVSLDGADHLLTQRRDADFAAGVIAAWASRYLPSDMHPEEAVQGAPVAALTREGKFQTRIRLRGGEIIADEPKEVGGLGTGPTPYELLGAGLAACTAMTLNLYTERKGWDLPLFEVEVTHEAGTPDVFTRKISFLEAVDAERQAKLLEIADKCPVHRTLERGSRIETVGSMAVLEPEPPAAHVEDMKAACEEC